MVKILNSLAIALVLASFLSCVPAKIWQLASVLPPLANSPTAHSFATHVVVVHVEDRENRATSKKKIEKNRASKPFICCIFSTPTT